MIKHENKENRQGTVLVIVVAILAVLMIFAATLALTTRVEMKTSENYEYDEVLSFLQRSVEQYAVDILRTDKYGSDDVPYNYEKLDGLGYPPSPINEYYPFDYSYSELIQDDENFDSYQNEEWLSPEDGIAENWRWFYFNNSEPRVLLYDSDGDDTDDRYANWLGAGWILGEDASLMGGKAKGEFALLFFDMGGSRLDINMTGNNATSPDDDQNQGISPFEINLSLLLGNSNDYVSGRYGGDFPETSDATYVRDHPYGGKDLDFDADGDVEDNVADLLPNTPPPGYFNPEWPIGDERPYGEDYLFPFLENITGDFTTRSGTTIIAGRSIRGKNAWDNTNPATDDLGSYVVLNQTGNWPVDDGGNDLVIQRAIQDIIDDADLAAKQDSAQDIYDFLSDLDVNVVGPTDRILQQIAVNLVDMIDSDSEPTHVSNLSYEFYGVERTPYIAEVCPAINSALHPYIPQNDGSVGTVESRFDGTSNIAHLIHGKLEEDTDGDGNPDVTIAEYWWYAQQNPGTYTDGDYQLEKSGTHDWSYIAGRTDGETWGVYTFTTDTWTENNPPTGWGKYIKLVNPWNKDIDLTGYEISFEGTSYVWNAGSWDESTVSVDIAIDANKTIPARGHFLLIDAETDPDGNPVFDGLPDGANYQVAPELTYLRDGVDVTLTDPDGNTVMETTLGSLGVDDGDDSGINPENFRPLSVQIDDPRPCWYRNGDQGEPWGEDAWVTDEDKTAGWNGSAWEWQDENDDPVTDTRALTWFNRNWRDKDDASNAVGVGDGYYLLSVDGGGVLGELPQNIDNLLHSFPPVVQEDAPYTGVTDHNTRIMNNGVFPSPGAISFAHAGIPWGTVSLTNPTNASDIGASDIVYLKNFTDYLVGPVSPYENGVDDDGDGYNDDDGTDSDDRFGPEIRQRGKVNVNTAPVEVLKAILKEELLEEWAVDAGVAEAEDIADDIARAIIYERNHGTDTTDGGPFSSVDDLFDRIPEIFGHQATRSSDWSSEFGVSRTSWSLSYPNSARREALARFMYNLVTVRTDVWGVVGKVRIYDDDVHGSEDSRTNNDQCDDGEEIVNKTFYMVIDRSFDPPRIVLRKSGD